MRISDWSSDVCSSDLVPPPLVEIEVAEHVFFDRSSEYVRRALAALNGAGVRIALDDFGTGYSSLSHLRDFSVDGVKIDRSEERRVGTEWVSTCRTGWWPYN